jgi:hypothetical protein
LREEVRSLCEGLENYLNVGERQPADDNQSASPNQRAPQISRSRKLLSQNERRDQSNRKTGRLARPGCNSPLDLTAWPNMTSVFIVAPGKAGVQGRRTSRLPWIPAFAGTTIRRDKLAEAHARSRHEAETGAFGEASRRIVVPDIQAQADAPARRLGKQAVRQHSFDPPTANVRLYPDQFGATDFSRQHDPVTAFAVKA